jgi:broad-specificity NMP kinase
MRGRKPNVLVTGTPGTGKSATVEGALEQLPGWRGLNVGAEVRAHRLWESEDADGTVMLDEERLLDHLEERLAEGGFVVEHHGCELFPERWFAAVVVLTADNTLLWDRLAARGYAEAKIANNVECEIMQASHVQCDALVSCAV